MIIETLIEILIEILILSTTMSTVVLLTKMSSAEEMLKKKGIDIKTKSNKKTSFKTEFSVFKKYMKIFIPFLNIKYMIDLINEDTEDFAERIIYDNERLGFIEKNTNLSKEDEMVKVGKARKISENIEKELNAPTFKKCIMDHIDLCDDIDTLKRINKIYYDKSLELRKEYYRIKESASNSELENILMRIKNYDIICVEAYNKIQYLRKNDFSKKL